MTASNRNINILIAGVGGQGVLVTSRLIGTMAVNSGMKVRISEDIGQAQRGGPVVSHIRLGEGLYAPIIPHHTVDLMIGFEPLETYRNTIEFLKPGGDVVFNDRPVYPSSNPKEEIHYPSVDKMAEIMAKVAKRVINLDAADLALQAGNPLAVNMVMLGAAKGFTLPFSIEDIESTIKSAGSGDATSNIRAFYSGLEAVKTELLRDST